jgi:hypothetical protein
MRAGFWAAPNLKNPDSCPSGYWVPIPGPHHSRILALRSVSAKGYRLRYFVTSVKYEKVSDYSKSYEGIYCLEELCQALLCDWVPLNDPPYFLFDPPRLPI